MVVENVRKKTISILLIIVIMLSQLFVPIGQSIAAEIEHTHIWSTKYDSTNHWEYCTVCGEKRNVTAHTFTDNWYYKRESCEMGNYSIRVCDCGYSYQYTKPHVADTSVWYNTAYRLTHYRKCANCNTWCTSERCHDENGVALSCKHTGTCVDCGVTATENMHYIVADGKCRDCGVKFFDVTKPQITYADDYTTADVVFTMTPLFDSVEMQNIMGFHNPNGFTTVSWSSVLNEDRSRTYTGHYTFNPERQYRGNFTFDNSGFAKINGQSVYGGGVTNFELWQDHTPPTITNITQVDQASSNGWATIREVTVEGTENLSNVVYITIKDKESGTIYVNNAATSVTSNAYSYSCTPSIEGDILGRAYVVEVRDIIGKTGITDNVASQEISVTRTDGTAPTLTEDSSLEYTNWTNSPKTVNLAFREFGSGGAELSFNDQDSYSPLPGQNSIYSWSKTFSDAQDGTSDYNVYVKDSLGNAARYTLTVGNIDYTKPTAVITPEACDWSKTKTVHISCSDEGGSGFKNYRYSITDNETNPGSWSSPSINAESDITINQSGQKYLHIKIEDNAGNVNTICKGIYRIDGEKPQITINGDFTHNYLNTVSVDISATDRLSGIKSIKLDGTEIAAGTHVFSQNGEHTVLAEDNCGNTIEQQFTIGNVTRECTKGLGHPHYNASLTKCPVCEAYEGLTAANVNAVYDGTGKGVSITNPKNADIVEYYDGLAIKPKTCGIHYGVLKVRYNGGIYDTGVEADLNITPKDITITGINAERRSANGSNVVNISGGQLQGVITGDNVQANLPSTGIAANSTVGEWNVQIGEISLVGADANNYRLIQPAYGQTKVQLTGKATITVRVNNKVYDGTPIVPTVTSTNTDSDFLYIYYNHGDTLPLRSAPKNPGVYDLEVYQEASGLYENTTSDKVTFRIFDPEDTQGPRIFVSPENSDWENTKTVHVEFDDLDGVGFKRFRYVVTNSNEATSNYGAYKYTQEADIVINQTGENYIHILAEDIDGNTSVVVKGPYKIDNKKPEIIVTGNLTSEVDNTLTLNISSTDEHSGIKTLTLDGNVITDPDQVFTVNGTHIIQAEDNCSNIEIKTIEINNICYNCNKNLGHIHYSSDLDECIICKIIDQIDITKDTKEYNGQVQRLSYTAPEGATIVEYYNNEKIGPKDAGAYHYELKVKYQNVEYNTAIEGTFTIKPKEISIVDVKAVDREFDGTNVVQITHGELNGVIAPDEVEAIVPATGTIDSIEPGTRNVEINQITLSGEHKDNYVLKDIEPLSVIIDKKTPNLIVKCDSKVFDGQQVEAEVEEKENTSEVIFIYYNHGQDIALPNAPVMPGTYDVEGYQDADTRYKSVRSQKVVFAITEEPDVTAPIVQARPENCDWGSGLTVHVEFEDTQSGFKHYRYEITNSSDTPTMWSTARYGLETDFDIRDDGEYFIHIKTEDIVGNISDDIALGPYRVDNADPTLEIIADLETEVIDELEVNIVAEDPLSGIKSIKVNGDPVNNGINIFTVNGTYEIEVEDNCGHRVSQTITINNIMHECNKHLDHPHFDSRIDKCPVCEYYEGLEVVGETERIYDGTQKSIHYNNPKGVEVVEYYNGTKDIPKRAGTYPYVLKIVYNGTEYETECRGDFVIQPKTITITGIEIPVKIYDEENETNEVNVVGGKLEGVVEGDQVEAVVPETAIAEGSTVGEWNVYLEEITLTGEDASNYELIQPEGLKVNIVDKITLETEEYDFTNRGLEDKSKVYDQGYKYIIGIDLETTKEEFIGNLITNGNVRILDLNGEELEDGEFIGTGMTLEVTHNYQKIELKIVVLGDVTGDGMVTVTDLSAINQAALKIITLEGEYFLAGDLDQNGNISATDLSTEGKVLLKLVPAKQKPVEEDKQEEQEETQDPIEDNNPEDTNPSEQDKQNVPDNEQESTPNENEESALIGNNDDSQDGTDQAISNENS